mmetsp:Transcript_99684/g.191350  ORF Transcript_99684/g.191350 Transcript_99684/m.191350 type:complete len:390 (+) Transcript_99684:682-1851(+)
MKCMGSFSSRPSCPFRRSAETLSDLWHISSQTAFPTRSVSKASGHRCFLCTGKRTLWCLSAMVSACMNCVAQGRDWYVPTRWSTIQTCTRTQAFFVLPMLQFFALPDYCFDEIRVPHWAYDKRLSIHYRGDNTPVEVSPGVCCSAEQSLGVSLASEVHTGKNGAMFSLVKSKEVVPAPGPSAPAPQLVMSPYNTPAPAARPMLSAATARPARYPTKPGPSVVIKPPSLQEVMRIRLEREGRSSEDAVECFGDMTDVVTVSTKTVEEAATMAVSRFLSTNGTNGIEILDAPSLEDHPVSDLLGPDSAPESSKPQPPVREQTKDENDLPEPASEGSFVKVPLTKRGGPHLSLRDQMMPQAVSGAVLEEQTTAEDWNHQGSAELDGSKQTKI